MARNTEKYLYIIIGLPHDSPMTRQLQEESRVSGTSLSKLIPVKLQERYGDLPLPEASRPGATVGAPISAKANANALAFLDGEDE